MPCTRGSAVPSTPELPESLPLPRATVVTAVAHRGEFVRVDLRVPLGLDRTVDFILRHFEPAGYEFEEGEREGTAAEMEFEGHEQRGRLRVYHDRCPGRTHADLVLAPE